MVLYTLTSHFHTRIQNLTRKHHYFYLMNSDRFSTLSLPFFRFHRWAFPALYIVVGFHSLVPENIPVTQLNFWKHDFCSGIFRIVCMCILNQVINLNCNMEEIFWHAHYYVGYAKNSILQMEIPFEKWFCDYSVFALFQYTRNFGNELYKTFVMKTA